jgi:hypothetical protein
MNKLITIPEEEDVLINLKIKAVRAGKDLKNYIQDLLIEHSKS